MVRSRVYLTKTDVQHGVKRSRLSAQAAEAKRVKEQAKIEAYTALQQDVLARVSSVRNILTNI